MIKHIPAIQMLRKIPVKKTARKCFVGIELAGIAGTGFVVSDGRIAYENITKALPIKHKAGASKTLSFEAAQKKLAETNRIMLVKKAEENYLKRKKAIIAMIMKEDKNLALGADTAKIAENIVKVAQEYGADPIHIACIAKKETHFTENINKGAAKGMMQVTPIVSKDMFQRPNIYHEKLSDITSKYKNSNELYKDLQKKPLLNLRVGTLLYLSHLKNSQGNIRQALMKYNGSKRKAAYAETVLKDIRKYENRFSY